jgi:hypothetical protein
MKNGGGKVAESRLLHQDFQLGRLGTLLDKITFSLKNSDNCMNEKISIHSLRTKIYISSQMSPVLHVSNGFGARTCTSRAVGRTATLAIAEEMATRVVEPQR